MELDLRLLEILACPLCRTKLALEAYALVCTQCARRYPIREGIPVMLAEAAEPPPEAKL